MGEGSKQFSQSLDATKINISIDKVRPVALVLTLPLTLYLTWVTKTGFLLTISIQYQSDKLWEYLFWIFFRLGKPKNSLLFVFQQTDFPIFENSTLFSLTKRKEKKVVLKLWEISWPQNVSLEILQRIACVSLSCVTSSIVFIVINEPCVYF